MISSARHAGRMKFYKSLYLREFYIIIYTLTETDRSKTNSSSEQ